MSTRVLLISPLPDLDPPSGDVTYTRQLLAAPPPGVAYCTYDEALREGSLIEVGTRASMTSTRGRRTVPRIASAAARKVEYSVRRSGVTYRELTRVFHVDDSAFDLVHVHVFNHRIIGARPPVVASAGGPLRWVYGDAWGWTDARLKIADMVDSFFGASWDATLCGRRLGQADHFIAPSVYLRNWLVERGWKREDITVIPNYLVPPDRPASDPDPRHTPTVLGFIARDFSAKGGPVALEVFRRLSERRPDLRLVVAGSPPPNDIPPQVTWLGEVGREELLESVLPRIDVLIYPSRCDTGVPYSAMEALALGIPAVVSDYRSLPDLVGIDAGEVASLDDVGAFAEATERLLESTHWRAARTAARARFDSSFSATTQSQHLAGAYRQTQAIFQAKTTRRA